MLDQLNYHGSSAVGKTIAAAVLDYDTVRLIFTDGTFVNAELRQESREDSAGIYHDTIEVKSNLAGGHTNPYEANRLREQGIITQAEYDAFAVEYNAQSVRQKENALERERREYLRLREKFNP